MIRLIATDMDGTLLRSDGSVSHRTCAALRRVAGAGLVIVLVSARPPRRMRLLASQLGIGGVAVCCNGALTYDLGRDEIIDHQPCPATSIRALVDTLRADIPGVCFAFELGQRFGCEAAYADLYPAAHELGPVVGDVLEHCDAPITTLMVRHATVPVELLLKACQGAIAGRAAVTHSGGPFVEITAAGVNKASALAAICGALGIGRREVLAFGDMPNDLPMLSWAGQSVAVANAHPEVQAKAMRLTTTNDEDGVARVLERLRLPQKGMSATTPRRLG